MNQKLLNFVVIALLLLGFVVGTIYVLKYDNNVKLIFTSASNYALPQSKSDFGIVKGQIKYGPTNPLGGFCQGVSRNVEIDFKDTNGKIYTAYTDNQGMYEIQLPPGTYTMTFPIKIDNGPGVFLHRQNVTINVRVNGVIQQDGCWDTGIR